MYWTDWGSPAKIERASMDGSSRTVLHNTSLVWPNALTLDYDTQTLYWMDAFLNKLESSGLDGSNRRLLSTFNIHHPFGVDIYRGRLYWTDWLADGILTAPINQLTDVSVVFGNLRLDPQGIKVVCQEKQPDGMLGISY